MEGFSAKLSAILQRCAPGSMQNKNSKFLEVLICEDTKSKVSGSV